MKRLATILTLFFFPLIAEGQMMMLAGRTVASGGGVTDGLTQNATWSVADNIDSSSTWTDDTFVWGEDFVVEFSVTPNNLSNPSTLAYIIALVPSSGSNIEVNRRFEYFGVADSLEIPVATYWTVSTSVKITMAFDFNLGTDEVTLNIWFDDVFIDGATLDLAGRVITDITTTGQYYDPLTHSRYTTYFDDFDTTWAVFGGQIISP